PGMFIAGADIREMGSREASPEQTRKTIQRRLAIITRFEELPYPTIGAIEGSCMGGGLEIALGCDYRVASTHPKTDLGLVETRIGLIPGGGGTQRLSRLIGPALAAELICPGDSVNAKRAFELGIVNDVVPSERLIDEAMRLMKWAQESGDWKAVRQRKRQPVGLSEDQQSFIFAVARAQVMAKTKGQLPAPLAALDAIAKGCNLPLEDGLKAETEAFLPLVGTAVSRILIAVFFMTQRLQAVPGVAPSTWSPDLATT